ncbi:PAS domain S-box protein [Pseudoduganella violacea]|uniref:histidine kinase n=1 Tax=Pseudoduganella violacea TaxID=1715466 RepID=A0A7W5FS65_9BURK|nr:PAS domain S-box protein [Pseudoduganella violacea]MBB3117410.1 PAS domain S-box-containing protein [Pseudoduganella violacea]
MSELAQLRLLLDSSSDVHWLIDCASGRLLYLSAAHAAFGFSAEEAQRHADQLLAQLPARLARFKDGDASRLRLRRELVFERADGSSLTVEIESLLVLDKKGQPLQLAGVVRDLSRQLAERAEWETQQKRFASMLSHEFRTPLSTIDGCRAAPGNDVGQCRRSHAQALPQDPGGGGPPDRHDRRLSVARASGQHRPQAPGQ